MTAVKPETALSRLEAEEVLRWELECARRDWQETGDPAWFAAALRRFNRLVVYDEWPGAA